MELLDAYITDEVTEQQVIIIILISIIVKPQPKAKV